VGGRVRIGDSKTDREKLIEDWNVFGEDVAGGYVGRPFWGGRMGKNQVLRGRGDKKKIKGKNEKKSKIGVRGDVGVGKKSTGGGVRGSPCQIRPK